MKRLQVSPRPAVLGALLCLMVVAAAAQAEEEAPMGLALSPSPAPRLPLAHQLTVPIYEQQRGNAAVIYARAVDTLPKDYLDDGKNRVSDWLKAPIEDLPLAEAQGLLDQCAVALRELGHASRCSSCDWELRFDDGFAMVLGQLGSYRDLARLANLQARVCVRQGRYDEAVEQFRRALTLARHIGQGQVLIHYLVGLAITQQTLGEMENFVAAPDAPNLYWPLTALPKPLFDADLAMESEQNLLAWQAPGLRRLDREVLTASQARGIVQEVLGKLQEVDVGLGANLAQPLFELGAVAVVMRDYPAARTDLIERGWSASRIDAMPAAQVVLLQAYQHYLFCHQNQRKWFHLPYWQGRPGLDQVDIDAAEPQSTILGQFVANLIPAVQRIYELQELLERRLAALRTVEALRLHAGVHNGQLPGSLAEVAVVPLPADPFTGEPFTYRADPAGGYLLAEPPTVISNRSVRGYRLTTRPASN